MDYSKLPELVQEQINKATQEKINFNQSSLSDVMGDTYSNILTKANRDIEKSIATLLPPDIQVGILRDGYEMSIQIHVTKPPFDSLGNKITDPLTCEIWKSIGSGNPDRIQSMTGDVYSYDYVDKNVNKDISNYTYTAILINQSNGSRSQSKPFVISTVKNYQLAKPATPTITTNGEETNRNLGTCSVKIAFLPNSEDEYKNMSVYLKEDSTGPEDDDVAIEDMKCVATFNKDEATLVGGYDNRVISGLAYGKQYLLRIVAVDYENGFSDPSDLISFTAGDQTPPEKVTNITITNISQQISSVDHYGIKLTYKYPKPNNDGVFDVKGIRVRRYLYAASSPKDRNTVLQGFFWYDASKMDFNNKSYNTVLDDENISYETFTTWASAVEAQTPANHGKYLKITGNTTITLTAGTNRYGYTFDVLDYAGNYSFISSQSLTIPDPTEIGTITVTHTNSDKIAPLQFDWTYTGTANTRLIAQLKPEYVNTNKYTQTTAMLIRKDFYNSTSATITFTQNEFAPNNIPSWEYPFGPSFGLADKNSPSWSISRANMVASGNNFDVFLYEWTGSDPVNPTLTLIAQGEFEYRPVPIDLEDFKTIYDPATDTITVSFGKWDSANETNVTVNTAHTDRYHTVIWDDLVDEHNDGYPHYRTVGETSFKIGGGYSTASATFPATDLTRTFKGIKQYWGDHDDTDNVYYSRNTVSSTVVVPKKIGKMGAPTVTPGKRRFTVSWPTPSESYATRIKSYKIFMASAVGGPWPGDAYPWDVSGEVAEISGNTIEIVKDLDGDAFPPEPVTRYFKIIAVDKYLPATLIPIWGSSSDTAASTSIDATPPVISFISTSPDMSLYKIINASAVSITALVTDSVNNISSVSYRIYEVGAPAPAFVAASCVGLGGTSVTAIGWASATGDFTIPNNASYVAEFQALDIEGNAATANYIFSRDTASATAVTAGSATAVLAAGTNDGIILTINNYTAPANFKEFIWEYSVASSAWTQVAETTATTKVVSISLSGDIYFRVKVRKLHSTDLDSAYTASEPAYVTLDILKPEYTISFSPDITTYSWVTGANYKTLTANIIVTDNADMTGATDVIMMSFNGGNWTASGVDFDIRPASSTVASGVWTDADIANGNHNIRFRFKDKYGNYEFSQLFYFSVDSNVVPNITCTIMNETGTGCTNNRAIELRAIDDINFPCANFNRLIYYYGSSTDYTILGETTDAVNGLFTTVLTKDFNPLYIKLIQENKALRTSDLSTSIGDSTIVDTVAPAVAITTIYKHGTSENAINGKGYTKESSIDVSFTATDSGTGVMSTAYSVDGGFNWFAHSSPIDITLADEGVVNLKIKVVDSATNATITERTFTRDVTPPSSATGFSGTYKKAGVDITWTNPTDADFDHISILASSSAGPVLYEGNSVKFTIPKGSFDSMVDSIKILHKSYDFAGNGHADYASATFTNFAPDIPSAVNSAAVPRGVRFSWPANSEEDFDYYEYCYSSGTSFSSATGWVAVQGNSVVISVDSETTLDQMQRESNFGIYLSVKAVDAWGKKSSAATAVLGKALAITYVDFGNNPMQFVVWDSDTGTRVNNINNTDYMKLIDNDF